MAAFFGMFPLWVLVFSSIFLSISFLRSHIIKVLQYIITVHIYLKSLLGECAASLPLLSLRIIKCYYLHPLVLLQRHNNDLGCKLEMGRKKRWPPS